MIYAVLRREIPIIQWVFSISLCTNTMLIMTADVILNSTSKFPKKAVKLLIFMQNNDIMKGKYSYVHFYGVPL